jgi:hypothetical protein
MFPACTVEQCQESLTNQSEEQQTETCDEEGVDATVGAVIGIVLAVAAIGAGVTCCVVRCRKQANGAETMGYTPLGSGSQLEEGSVCCAPGWYGAAGSIDNMGLPGSSQTACRERGRKRTRPI